MSKDQFKKTLMRLASTEENKPQSKGDHRKTSMVRAPTFKTDKERRELEILLEQRNKAYADDLEAEPLPAMPVTFSNWALA